MEKTMEADRVLRAYGCLPSWSKVCQYGSVWGDGQELLVALRVEGENVVGTCNFGGQGKGRELSTDLIEA